MHPQRLGTWMAALDVDVHKKVEHAISCEEVDVTAQLKSLCCFVRLNRIPDESNSDKQKHQCTQYNLHRVCDIYEPEWNAAI